MAGEGAHPSGIDAVQPDPRPPIPHARVAVGDMIPARVPPRPCRESPRGMTRLHKLWTDKFPPRGVSAPAPAP